MSFGGWNSDDLDTNDQGWFYSLIDRVGAWIDGTARKKNTEKDKRVTEAISYIMALHTKFIPSIHNESTFNYHVSVIRQSNDEDARNFPECYLTWPRR